MNVKMPEQWARSSIWQSPTLTKSGDARSNRVASTALAEVDLQALASRSVKSTLGARRRNAMSRTPRYIILIIRIRYDLAVVLVWIICSPRQNIGGGFTCLQVSMLIRACAY